MDPKEYLRLSRQILINPDTNHEAGYRSVTSRAYYAAFNVCCDILNHFFRIPKTGSAHEVIQKFLNNSSNKQLVFISLKLKDLMFSRKKADYDNKSQGHSREMALTNLQTAEEIIAIAEAVFLSPEKDDIVTAMWEYNAITKLI